MDVVITLPEELLRGDSPDISRRILEQVALDGFKSGQLSAAQVRRILGLDTRFEVYEFLTGHGVPWVDYDESELQREVELLEKLVP